MPVLSAEHPFLMTFVIEDGLNIQKVATNLRSILRFSGSSESFTVTVKETSREIFVGTKRGRQESREKSLIRKLMLAVDDENLCDEAMEILYGT